LKNKEFFIKYLPILLAIGLFLFLLAAGFSLYKDFGVPVDEPARIQDAIKNHRYIFQGDTSLLSLPDRYHGMTFELPLFWAATRFKGPEMVYVRHLLLYLAFLASLAIFYFLSLRLFFNPWWGLLAVCMLALSPRIFSDAFYNSKDIALMDVFILAIWTLLININITKKRKTITQLLLVSAHALVSALLIGTRIVGVLIVPLSVILLGIAFYTSKKSWKWILVFIALYLVLTAGLTVLFWPVLWRDPLHEFINAFQQLSRYEEYGKGVLFQGLFYSSTALPWQYLPVWISISTPIIILIGVVIGIGNWLQEIFLFFRKKLGKTLAVFSQWISNLGTLDWLAIAGWLTIPVISVYFFHSVLYNGWRHLFFIYPAMVLFSTRGFSSLFNWLVKITKRQTLSIIILVFILAIGFLEPASFLVRYPCYGTVYFNQFAGDPKTLRQRFETDYWGLSYKEAIDHILSTDPSDKIPIYMSDVSGLDYINSELPPEQKVRLVVLKSPDEGARYFIGNYSFHPGDYYPASQVFYAIDVRGIQIIIVNKFR
jgi:hypothetical protein